MHFEIIFVFLKMYESKKRNGDDAETFIGRLIDVSNKNANFTTENVFGETATILTGVKFFIFVLI